MIHIAVTVGDVCTDIVTDQVLSFDAIDSILTRACSTTLDAYNGYTVVNGEFEISAEDDN